MNLDVGTRFLTRSGAVVEITERRDSGLHKYSLDWRMIGRAYLIHCKIVRGADGELVTAPCGYCVHDDGRYESNGDHELDLVKEIAYRGKAAA